MNISATVRELYENCTQQLFAEMPDYYAIETRKLMSRAHYERTCYERESICRCVEIIKTLRNNYSIFSLNRAFLYPFTCLARRKCSAYLADAFFTLVYVTQQLTLETNEPLL